jgi:hypothetical protein
VGRGTWETFSGSCRASYWVQYTDTFGSSIEFINDQWYNIFWSYSFNSYYTETEHSIEDPEDLGLGTLANFLKVQGIIKARNTTGKKACPLRDQASIQHRREPKRQTAAPFKKASANWGKNQKSLQGH